MVSAAAERNRDPKKSRTYRIQYNAQLRAEVLQAYGNMCACCEEVEPKFLSIDHPNNDGAEHRRRIGVNSGFHFYLWLRREGFPEGFQVLCHNCNQAKGSYGQCPHEEAVRCS